MPPGWCAAAFCPFGGTTDIDLDWLLELATMAIADADGTVRVSGTEILSRIVRGGLSNRWPPSPKLVAAAATGW